MKIPIKIAVTILIFAILSCTGFNAISSDKMLQYGKWKNSILSRFDSLANDDLKKIDSNDVSHRNSRKIDFCQIKDVLDDIDSVGFYKMLNSAVSLNQLKKWNRMYYVFWYQEGEIAMTVVTFIFYTDDNKSWAISYVPYSEYGPIKAGLATESDLNHLDDKFGLYNGEFFTISKFDSGFNCLSNKIVIGLMNEYPKVHSLFHPE